jgi:cytochrome c biogenesis protein CcmG, thiol:disulfide interchange protein DsbE
MRWVVIGVAALLVGLLVYGVAEQGAKTTASAALDVGERPPGTSQELALLGSQDRGAIDDYRGKVVLVNFWGSWCPPCTAELPLLERTHKQLTELDATVIGVNSLDNSEAAMEFVDDLGVTFPSLRDGDGDFADSWGAAQLPESFLLDREGRVAALIQGPVTPEFIAEQVLPLARQ